MVKQFAHVQVNLNSFLVMLKMDVFVMPLPVRLISIAAMAFVATDNAQSPVEIKTIVLMANIARITDV